jgi:hypothetical protein
MGRELKFQSWPYLTEDHYDAGVFRYRKGVIISRRSGSVGPFVEPIWRIDEKIINFYIQ